MSTPTEKEQVMSQVIADMSMSLDGFIADRDDSVEQLFGWFFGGDVEVPTATPGASFRTPAPSAEVMRDALQNVGALVSGRRNFDLVAGWGGAHPMGVPVYVVTHQAPDGWPADGPMRFVTDGVERPWHRRRPRRTARSSGSRRRPSSGSASTPGCSTRST
jgi:dihydrofolate reductase